MKTDFEKYRRCVRGVQACGLIGLLLLCGILLLMKRAETLGLERLHVLVMTLLPLVAVVSGIASVLCLMTVRYTKCPYCRKSVLSKWWNYGRATRIQKRLPVVCPHCGEEIETQ